MLILAGAILIIVVERICRHKKTKLKDTYKHPNRDRFWNG